MRDTRRTKRENVNKLPLSINNELFHTSDLLTRNIEPKSKIWSKSNCHPDQPFLRLLSSSLLINAPVWSNILCSMPCHLVYCKRFFWMTNPPDLYFDRHNKPLQCWIIQQNFFLETDFKLNYKPMCHNCQGGKKKMSQNSISKVLRQNFLWYGKRYWLHKFKFASKFETLETDVFSFVCKSSHFKFSEILLIHISKEMIFMWFTPGIVFSMNNKERQYSQMQPRKRDTSCRVVGTGWRKREGDTNHIRCRHLTPTLTTFINQVGP